MKLIQKRLLIIFISFFFVSTSVQAEITKNCIEYYNETKKILPDCKDVIEIINGKAVSKKLKPTHQVLYETKNITNIKESEQNYFDLGNYRKAVSKKPKLKPKPKVKLETKRTEEKSNKNPNVKPLIVKNNVKTEMVYVEGGTFTMGDGKDKENQKHIITISSFYMAKYETTQSEYQSLIGSNPSIFKGSNLPVEKVSWFDAIKYCNKKSRGESFPVAYSEGGKLLDSSGNITSDVTQVKGYRLPTEAEWEFAARGGKKSQGYTYAGSNNENEVAWYDLNSRSKMHEVGIKKPNELGLYDMSGNVDEWCTDWYISNYYNSSSIINPVNTESNYDRVIRGGNWGYGFIRVAQRRVCYPTTSYDSLGFRLARTP